MSGMSKDPNGKPPFKEYPFPENAPVSAPASLSIYWMWYHLILAIFSFIFQYFLLCYCFLELICRCTRKSFKFFAWTEKNECWHCINTQSLCNFLKVDHKVWENMVWNSSTFLREICRHQLWWTEQKYTFCSEIRKTEQF